MFSYLSHCSYESAKDFKLLLCVKFAIKINLSYSGSWSGLHHGGQPGCRKEDRTG